MVVLNGDLGSADCLTFANVTLDRIVHNAHGLELDGPSMRKIKADKNRPAAIDQTQRK